MNMSISSLNKGYTALPALNFIFCY